MPSAADLLLLGFLARKPMHGYEIRQVLDDSDVEDWTSISTTHIYWVLGKLEREGLVEVAVEQEGNRPPRKKYSLTQQGREAALRILREGVGTEQMTYFDIDVVLIIMGLLPDLSSDECTQLLERRRCFLERQIERTRQVWDSSTRSHKAVPAVRLVYEHRLVTLQTELDWICKVIELVQTIGWESFHRITPLSTVPV